jgi:endonuclease-3
MAVVKKTKASDLHSLSKKLVALLKKHYSLSSPKKDKAVLETMLHAVCLENATQEQADAASEMLHKSFHDFNEIRVSTFGELTACFEGMSDPDARAARVRAILQYVFEINFDFDFESLRRKTLELAEKQLQKIRFLSSFIQLYTLQKSLSTHTVPVDDRIHDAAIWLGLAAPGCTPAEVADGLKSAVMKADTATFCDYMRCFATDPRLVPTFAKTKPPEEGFDLDEMLARATDLLNNASKVHKAHKSKPEKPAAKSKPTSKADLPKAKAGTAKKKPR